MGSRRDGWKQPSFEQNQHHYIVSSANLYSHQSTAEEKHGAAVYLSAVKSKYSYFIPEVQARLVKAVSIIFYWEWGNLKRPTVSIEVSAKVSEVILEEPHDRKIRQLARKCETQNVDLSEEIPDAHLEQSGNKMQVSWPQSVQDAFHLDVHYQQCSPNFNPFTPKKVNFKFLLQPHQKYYIR